MYDMATDRCEQHNVAAANSERVRKMAGLWKDRDAEYVRVREAAPATTKKRM